MFIHQVVFNPLKPKTFSSSSFNGFPNSNFSLPYIQLTIIHSWTQQQQLIITNPLIHLLFSLHSCSLFSLSKFEISSFTSSLPTLHYASPPSGDSSCTSSFSRHPSTTSHLLQLFPKLVRLSHLLFSLSFSFF